MDGQCCPHPRVFVLSQTKLCRRDVWWLKTLVHDFPCSLSAQLIVHQVGYLFLAETFMTIAELGICYEPFIMRNGMHTIFIYCMNCSHPPGTPESMTISPSSKQDKIPIAHSKLTSIRSAASRYAFGVPLIRGYSDQAILKSRFNWHGWSDPAIQMKPGVLTSKIGVDINSSAGVSCMAPTKGY